MARRSIDKSTAKTITTATEDVAVVEVENAVDVEEKEVISKEIEEPLTDSDEIEVVSLIDNVHYKDNKSGDNYDWDKAGHIEVMTYGTIKELWRQYKSYFKNLWLRPKDDRVVKKLGLTKTYEQFEFLTNFDNYTRKNLNKISEAIDLMPNGLKMGVGNRIKVGVKDGEISDISVIRMLERKLNLDLIGLL